MTDKKTITINPELFNKLVEYVDNISPESKNISEAKMNNFFNNLEIKRTSIFGLNLNLGLDFIIPSFKIQKKTRFE